MYKLLLDWPRLRYALAGLVAAATTTGCVRVEHPLSEVGEVITDDAIVGSWQLQDPLFGPSKDNIEITALGDGIYRWSNGGSTYHEFKIVRAAGADYLEVVRCVQNGAEDIVLASIMSFPTRWERRGDWMRLEYPSNLEKFVGEGKSLTGSVSSEPWFSTGTVTSSAAELEAFLTEHAGEAYRQQSVWRKTVSEQMTP
jgi:hypothetical protein